MPLYPTSDLAAIAALVNSAYRGEASRRGWTTEADYLDGQRTAAATLAHDLATTQDAALLGWRETPEAPLIGCVWLEPAETGVWHLGLLTVAPDLQNRRLGRDVLAAAEAFAAARGARRVRMTVVNVRDALIAWYQRRGYVLTGETRPFPYGDDRFGVPRRDDLAFVVLEKPLD